MRKWMSMTHYSPGEGGFVIQFRAPRDVEQGRFKGRAEHVASGEVGHFQTPEELAAFIRNVLGGQHQESEGLTKALRYNSL
jgi:hypothetical protein